MQRMKEYLQSPKNPIFVEDLKVIFHLASSSEELDLVEDMLKV